MDRRSGHGGIGRRAASASAVGCLCLLLGVAAAGCGTSASPATSTAPGVDASPLTRIRASVGVTEAAGTAHFVTASTVQQAAGSTPAGVLRTAGTGDVRFAGPDIETETSAVPPTSPPIPSTRVLRIGDTVYVNTPPATGGRTRTSWPATSTTWER